MSPYLACALLVATALVQTTVGSRLTLLGVQPNFMFLVVFSWSLLRGGREGMLWAFAGGMLLDILSGAPLGVSALSLLLISLLSGLGEATTFRTSFFLLMVGSFAVSLFHDLVFLVILQLMGWSVEWPMVLWRLLFPAAGLNMAFMPAVYALMRWLHRRTKGRELAW